MKYTKSIIRWLSHSNKSSNQDFENLFYALLSIVFFVLAIWFYRGTNARLLGPPFGEISGQDFRQILRASREIQKGENIYQHALPYATAPNFGEFMSWSASPYPYSPIVAVLAIPFLHFEEKSVLMFWTIFSWILLIGTVIIIVRHILDDKNPYKLLAVFLFFAIYGPVHLNLNLVQLDILILFLVSLSFMFYRKRSIYSGLILGLAISLKLLIAPMVAYFLWKKDWKTSVLAMMTFGVLNVIGFSIAGWGQFAGFVKVNYLWSVTDMLAYPFNQSINGLSLRLFTENSYIEPLFYFPPMVAIIRVLVSMAAIILWLKVVERVDNRASNLGFLEYGFTLSTMLFLSPLVDDIHYVWILLPIGGLLALISQDITRKRSQFLALGILLCTLLLANPDLHDAIYYGWENLVYNNTLVSQKYGILTGAYLYGLIGLEICLLLTINHFRKNGSLRD